MGSGFVLTHTAPCCMGFRITRLIRAYFQLLGLSIPNGIPRLRSV